MLQTALAALIGAALFHRLGVPAGALLGAMLAVAALNVAGREAVALPGSLQFLAFAALGWSIGAGVTRETVTTLQHSLLPLTVVVASLLIFGCLVAFLVAAAGWTDGTTAYLATSPGALSQMSALADALNANAPLVAAVHTIRVFAVIILAPIVARLLAGAG